MQTQRKQQCKDEAEIEMMQSEDRRVHKPRNAGNKLKKVINFFVLKKTTSWILPSEPWEAISSDDTLALAQ